MSEHEQLFGPRIERAERLAICLDFDGTLAPISEDPEAVELDPAIRDVLHRLVETPDTLVAIISGRSLDDLRSRVEIDGVSYAGNHGLEIEHNDERWVHPVVEQCRPVLERVRDQLAESLNGIPGADIEDKYATLTVHYRRTPPTEQVTVAELTKNLVETVPELHWKSGKAVVQVRPNVDWNKGNAVRALAPAAHGSLVLFAGDDRTDVDGFEALRDLPIDGIAIGVGDPDLPADLHLRDAGDVADTLRWIYTKWQTNNTYGTTGTEGTTATKQFDGCRFD